MGGCVWGHLLWMSYHTCVDLGTLSTVSVFLHTETCSDRVWLRWLRRDFTALRPIRDICIKHADAAVDVEHKTATRDDALSPTDQHVLLQAINAGDAVTASRLASEAAHRVSLSTTGHEPFIAPVDPVLGLFDAELASHAPHTCTPWYDTGKTCKQHYEDEIRRYYDECLVSHEALAAYLQARPELIHGLTAMCRQPHVGTAMEM